MLDPVSRRAVLTDVPWERIDPLLPSDLGKPGRRFRDHRQVIEGISTGTAPGLPARSASGVRAMADGLEAPSASLRR
jgi:transposase